MANVNKVKAQGAIYDIEDTAARTSSVVVTSKADGSVELRSPTSTVTVPSITNFGDPSELENDVVTEISELKSEIGSLSDLETTDKTDIVSAINELSNLKNDVSTLRSSVYNLGIHEFKWDNSQYRQKRTTSGMSAVQFTVEPFKVYDAGYHDIINIRLKPTTVDYGDLYTECRVMVSSNDDNPVSFNFDSSIKGPSNYQATAGHTYMVCIMNMRFAYIVDMGAIR